MQEQYAEFIDFLFADGERVIAVIKAYLDESGTHSGAPLVVVAGFIGDRKAWKSFVKEWRAILQRAGIDYFNANDPKCEPLKAPLARAILKRNLLGVAWSVDPLDFKEIASQKFMSRFGNAYSTCAYLCAGMISQLAKQDGWPSVALVYEDGQSNTEFIYNTLSAMKADPVDHRFGSITFMNKKDPGGIPLQAADFLSHIIATNETKWINNFDAAHKFIPPVTMPPEKLKQTVRKIEDMIIRQRALRRKARRESLTSLDGEPDTT
jgi:hypothetical protein